MLCLQVTRREASTKLYDIIKGHVNQEELLFRPFAWCLRWCIHYSRLNNPPLDAILAAWHAEPTILKYSFRMDILTSATQASVSVFTGIMQWKLAHFTHFTTANAVFHSISAKSNITLCVHLLSYNILIKRT